jgi:hypothetical protein
MTTTLLTTLRDQLSTLNREQCWTPAREALAVRLSDAVRYLSQRAEAMRYGETWR